jgi:hypothetical protein
MTTTATTYADAVREIADDVIRQLEDGHAASRQHNFQTAAGDYLPSVRVFFADFTAEPEHGIPAGVARVALDLAPYRRPANEVRVLLEAPTTNGAAHDIAAAVLDMIDHTADYAR